MKPDRIRELVKETLEEDLGKRGDVTSLAIIAAEHRSEARVVAREDGVLCGVDVALEAFRQRDPGTRVLQRRKDGNFLRKGDAALWVRGRTRGILSAERVALNFLQRLSGIATLTARFVKEVNGIKRVFNRNNGINNMKKRVEILDTRKTTPLFRDLEKHAVRCGGGRNHRMGLHDMVLIKDNHLMALGSEINGEKFKIFTAVRLARRCWPQLKVEVECDTLEQVKAAILAKVDRILLDNMTLDQMRKAVGLIQGRVETEASGGITLRRAKAVARTGVDFISVGQLTHSAKAMDFSLEVK